MLFRHAGTPAGKGKFMNPRLKPLAALLPLLFISSAHAQQSLDAVVVTATRQPTRISETLADVTVLERADIEKATGSTTLELLARQPGLQLSNNGGAGKVSSIFIRGAEARHTLLLIDGVPLGSATTGTPSLADIPLAQIERIEIVRGPSSAVYGSDAIGGVIQIFTRRGEGPLRGDAFAGFGSKNTQEYSAGISGGSEIISGSLRLSHQTTDGFNAASDPIRFQAANFSKPNPDNDGYYQTALTGNFAIRPVKGHELGVTAYAVEGRNRYDGGGPTINAYADVRNSVFTGYTRNKFISNWTSLLRYGRSEDSSTNFAPNRSLFETTQGQWTWENQISLPVGNLLVGYEHIEQNVTSTTKYSVDERTVRSPFIGYSLKYADHSLQMSARHDDNSQFGGKNTGNLAYGYQFTKQLGAHGSIGTAFKAPTFNQLYFPNFGNDKLKPEEALNREIGLTWQGMGHRLGFVYFNNQITDLIGGFPLVNINQATIKGSSISYQGSIGSWTLQAAVDLMKPRDEATGNILPRRAEETANLALSYVTGPFRAGVELQSVGNRFDDSANKRPMAGYGLTNLFGSYQVSPDVRIEARVNNVFDKDYETAWAYAQAGVNAFLGIRYAPK
ncbi:MAG: TonB-dependent receptor [Betaproteobacteria bacterium HGW-Betaproteobacteria-10]|nr:MAG: TonB-dependent receptor [Betaproteobacteria bacterium HGW-Betaproteobacteria-10]